MHPLCELPAWRALVERQQALAGTHLRDLFARDPARAQRYTLHFDDVVFDFSKHRLDDAALQALYALADATNLRTHIEQMFTGEPINFTEGRSVLHVALRQQGATPLVVNGVDVLPPVRRVLAQMRELADKVRQGAWRGFTGKRISHIVNIGIGGSDLGPHMASEALRPYWHTELQPHYVSNVDGSQLAATLRHLDPARTLFCVASKTFGTIETLTNARSARKWLVDRLGSESAVASHFVAISTNRSAVAEFGIDPRHMFEFWDWVGGRYSLWSAIGLSLACMVGMDAFEQLLAGAHDVDDHFRRVPWAENLPVTMALLGIWYTNFWDAESHAVLPYDQRLWRLPAYLQQADMESNGKRVDRSGQTIINYSTGPIVWGEPGTNGQHAFYQLIHQGTHLIPIDFLAAVQPDHDLAGHHELLLANCLAQSEALMRGKTLAEATAELEAKGYDAKRCAVVAPHRVFPGNNPSSTLLFDRLTPRTLGRLIALYEHKIFAQGVIWRVNSFDQWGVELGKELATALVDELTGDPVPARHDSSTNALVEHVRHRRQGG